MTQRRLISHLISGKSSTRGTLDARKPCGVEEKSWYLVLVGDGAWKAQGRGRYSEELVPYISGKVNKAPQSAMTTIASPRQYLPS